MSDPLHLKSIVSPTEQTKTPASTPPNPKPTPTSGFDSDGWHAELWILNPWAEPFLKDGLQIATEEFNQTCLLASRARWLAGNAVWNGWAQGMLALKSKLEAAQLWYVSALGEGANDETKAWLAAAEAVFSTLTLERGNDGYIDFEGFIFPSNAWFVESSFTGETRFQNARFHGDAHFSRTRFIGKSSFEQVFFNGHARFREAKFTGNSRFTQCAFCGDAEFDRATFTGGTDFNHSKFGGLTNFNGSNFIGDATYEEVEFTGDASFSETRFAGTAWFPRCSFIGNTIFTSSVMIGDAWFSDTNFIGNVLFDDTKFPCNSRFENARFCGLSSFKNAEFSDSTQFSSANFVGETELAADSLPESAEINSITITGPLRKEREEIELQELFPSLTRNAETSLDGTEFQSVPDFQGVKMDEQPSAADMSVADPLQTQQDGVHEGKKDIDQPE